MNTRKCYQLSLLGSTGGALIAGFLLAAGIAAGSTLLSAFGVGIGGLAFAAGQIANHQRVRMSNDLHRKLTNAHQAMRGAVSADLERMKSVVESLHLALEGVAAENRSQSSTARADAIAIRQRINRRCDEVSQVVTELRDAATAQFVDFNASFVLLEASLQQLGAGLGEQSENFTQLHRRTERARRKEFRAAEDLLNRAMTALQALEHGEQSRANEIEELLKAESARLQTAVDRLAAGGESQSHAMSAVLRESIDSAARTIRKDIAAARESGDETAASTREALHNLLSTCESDRAVLSEVQTAAAGAREAAVNVHSAVWESHEAATAGYSNIRSELLETSRIVKAAHQRVTDQLAELVSKTASACRAADIARSEADAIRSEVHTVSTALRSLQQSVGDASGRLEQLGEIEGEHFSALQSMSTQLRVALEAIPQETRDYQQLTRTVGIDTVATPVTGGWSATPGLLVALCGEILDSGRAGRILDLGSGLTSLWAALSLKKRGSGSCISVDHISHFADQTAALAAEAGASDYVDIHCAELKPWSATAVPDCLDSSQLPTDYYDLSGISLGTLDVVVVDGPPGASGVLSRYPALPAVADHLAEGALILVDDTIRAEERLMIQAWKEALRGVGTLTETVHGAKFTGLRFTRR
ncbi:class I SAM-dependent methyltransferase [Brevibacterium otitidis]|uniref:Class I SAM-dependent methyltransferase n=1 Tax=Brevibacterium otitidis TaxID=53364 RepID=A0ABV5X5K2_9MICO|nr:hypothetical protein GCM10023233_01530 [Brevibacterium otitidis]